MHDHRRRLFIRSILALLVWTFMSGVTLAQPMTGALQARIVDSSGTPVPGANLTVSGPSIQGTRGSASDSLGYVLLLAIPSGNVSARVSHVAFQSVELVDVAIQLGTTTNLGDISLRRGTIDMPEILISGRTPFLDASTASTGSNLRSSDFEKLPLGRNYRSIATLVPQANESYFGDELNISGGTGRENKYMVDGVEITDWHFGRIETNLPYNFVKEIRVTSGGYEAEYDGSLGGLVSAVTNSGGNEIHGSIYGFYASDWMAAAPRKGLIDPAAGPFANYDIGGSIGFPIVRDALWVYAAYNPTYEWREVELPGIGTGIDKSITNAFAAKVAWKPSNKVELEFTSLGDPTRRTAVGEISLTPPSALANPDPYLANIRQGGIIYSLKSSYMVSERVFLDMVISKGDQDDVDEPSTDRGKSEVLFIDSTNTWSGGTGGYFSFRKHSTTAKMNATFILGSHLVKTGIEYRDHGVDADVDTRHITQTDYTTYNDMQNVTHGTVHNRIPSFYLQDAWQIGHDLRLNAGIRWDGQFLVASNGKVAQRITSQFQPRIGFVFMPGDDERHKIFGSFGRFAQELHTTLSLFYHVDQGYWNVTTYPRDPRTGNVPPTNQLGQILQISPEVPGLKGQYYDEFTLGYERALSTHFKVNVQGTYRMLREAIDDGLVGSQLFFGNPGRGTLSNFPRARREYAALAVTVEQHESDLFDFLASYVLSRNYGNYPGLFDTYFQLVGSNTSFAFDDIGALKNATGLLPNDRTHTFKFSGSCRVASGLTLGTSFIWQSGTPMSEWAGSASGFEWFLAPRGTAGRTPALWDLNARIAYDVPSLSQVRPRILLDLFHIASQRQPVNIVQEKSKTIDSTTGASGAPNPDYGKPYRYQPPMSLRLGLELDF